MTTIQENKKDLSFPEDFTLLDLETTGLSNSKNEIIEISAIKVRSKKIIDKFSMLVKPESQIGGFISNLTGITNNMVSNAPKIAEVLPKFMQFLGNDLIIGHNVKFDIGFLKANLEKLQLKELTNTSLDTMQISQKVNNLKSHSLDNLTKHYNINSAGHHRALNDCIMTFELYKKLEEEYKISNN